MKTYAINLKKETQRREYIRNLLEPYEFIDLEFVEGLDASIANIENLKDIFNIEKCNKHLYRSVTKPEIGCTISHHRCYKKFLRSNEDLCLILEDDIDTPADAFGDIIEKIPSQFNTSSPMIILLSDWYWFTKEKKRITENYEIVNVFNGYLAHAYIINRAAAEILIREKPDCIADEWGQIRKKGILIYAVLPHIIQQKWDGSFKTSIQNQRPVNSSYRLINFIRLLPERLYQFYLKKTNRFYAPHEMRTDENRNKAANN